MAASLNLCQFIGLIGKIEPARYMPDGKAVINLSMAVNESYKDKSGNKVEQVEWVRVSAFGKLAEIISQYCVVGMPIYIAGKMKTRKYDKDGVTHYSTEIIADTMQMLGSKGDSKPQPSSSALAEFDDSIPF